MLTPVKYWMAHKLMPIQVPFHAVILHGLYNITLHSASVLMCGGL